MQVRQLSEGQASIYAVVFEPGEEPVSGLVRFAREHGVDGAHLTAIGAFSSAKIGFFDLDARDYHVNDVNEQVEVVSLVGDITRAGPATDEPKVHVHVVLARRDGHALGGHLLEAAVRPTLEVVVTETPAVLRRRHDPETNLALIDLSQAAAPSSGSAGSAS